MSSTRVNSARRPAPRGCRPPPRSAVDRRPGGADRELLRDQSVGELTDEATFALAWLPAPFVPEEALRAGLPLLARALVPGGWLVVGHGKLDENPVDNALTRFKTVSYGGTELDCDQAQALLAEAPMSEAAPTGNPDVRVLEVEVVAKAWHTLRRTTYEYRHADGRVTTEQRETYDRGNGATILLHDVERGTVLLSRQFRYPVYANHHPDGMLIETAAGLLDGEEPATAIRREAAEELGVEVGEVEHVFDVYMSPGSVTERIHFFAAPYTPLTRVSDGGGLADDGEDIEVLELAFDVALAMVDSGEIADAKTIMLLQWAALRGPFSGS